MRIGIDGTCWLNRRGYGRFAHQLIDRLVDIDHDNTYVMVVDFDPADAPPIPAAIRVVRARTDTPAARAAGASGRRTLDDMWAVSRALSRERFDIVFFPTAYTYVPVFGARHVVVVIHDVIAEQFPRQVFPTRLAEAFWRLKLWAARRQADRIVTVSEASRRGIAAQFTISPERITVVPEAADPIFRVVPKDATLDERLARFRLLGRPFLLYVGGISPHKNLGALVQAFADLHRLPDYAAQHLVLVGDYSGDVFYSAYGQLRQQAEALGVADAVFFAGYVPDEDLVYLYNAANAFVLPSLLEGFGLPVIEAMACGAPVVASDRGALPEVIGAAGVLFSPNKPGDLRDALHRVLADAGLQRRLRALGPQRAAEFSWDRGARAMLAAFREVADGRG